MRGEDHVGQPAQRRLERVALRLGLDREDVERGPGDVAGEDVLPQGDVVDDHAARCVDEHRARLHLGELLGAEEPGVAWAPVDVQRDDVGLGEELVEGADAAGVAVGEPVCGVEEDHPEAERLGEVGQLGADVAVADDAQGAAADLVAALRGLVPDAVVHPLGLLGSRRARAMISPMTSSTTLRVLEYGALKAATPRGAAASRSIWLVPMQKAPTASRSVRSEDLLGDFGVRADADDRLALQRLDQLVLAQGPGEGVYDETVALEDLGRGGMDVLEEEDFVLAHATSLRGPVLTDRPHPRSGRRSPARPGTAAGSGRSRRPPCRG